MVELNPIEESIKTTMVDMGANSDEKARTADDIMKRCNKPKGLLTNTLMSLVNKGVVKRVAKEKAARYFVQ